MCVLCLLDIDIVVVLAVQQVEGNTYLGGRVVVGSLNYNLVVAEEVLSGGVDRGGVDVVHAGGCQAACGVGVEPERRAPYFAVPVAERGHVLQVHLGTEGEGLLSETL